VLAVGTDTWAGYLDPVSQGPGARGGKAQQQESCREDSAQHGISMVVLWNLSILIGAGFLQEGYQQRTSHWRASMERIEQPGMRKSERVMPRVWKPDVSVLDVSVLVESETDVHNSKLASRPESIRAVSALGIRGFNI